MKTKILSIFMGFLLTTVMLNSTPVDTFASLIAQTKFNEEIPRNLTFNNLENNVTQQEAKELFEKLLPYYLDAKDIFSEERMVERQDKEIEETIRKDKIITILDLTEEELATYSDDMYKDLKEYELLYYSKFFMTLNTYIGYLQKHPTSKNWELLLKLSQKALEDTTQQINNGQSSWDYAIISLMLSKLYDTIDDKVLIRNYPPPTQKLLMEKIRLDVKYQIKSVKRGLYYKLSKVNRLEEMKEKVDLKYRLVEEPLEKHLQRLYEVIKHPSPQKIEDFKNYKERLLLQFKQISNEEDKIKKRLREFKKISSPSQEMKSETKEDINRYNELRELFLIQKDVYIFIMLFPDIDAMLKLEKERQELHQRYNKKLEEKQQYEYFIYIASFLLGLFAFYLLWLLFDGLRWVIKL